MKKQSQKGLSFLGFLIVAAVAGFFLLTGFKIFKGFQEYWGVQKAMDQLSRKPNVNVMPMSQLWGQLDALFGVGYVTTPKSTCLTLDRKRGNVLTCEYEYRTNYVSNVDLAMRFKYAVSLNEGGPAK